jgi:hypothetical protein
MLGQQGQMYGQMAGQQQGLGALGGALGGVAAGQLNQAQAQQALQRQRFGDLGAVGAAREGRQQESLNLGYQDFQNQINQERRNIDWQQGAMQGLPYQGSQTTSMYGQQPTGGQSLLAGGVAGMGAYNAFRNQQGQPQQQQQQGSNFFGPGGSHDINQGQGSNYNQGTGNPVSGFGGNQSGNTTMFGNNPQLGMQNQGQQQQQQQQQGNAAAGGGW